MSQRTTDGMTKATFVPSIGSITGPTVAELTAGSIVPLEDAVTDDGLKIDVEEGTITGPTLASVQDFEKPGRVKAKIELTFYRDSGATADRPWSVMTRLTEGYLVVRRGVAVGTAYAVGQKIEVYTVTCGARRKVAPEREGLEKAMLTLFPSGTYTEEATVA